jgi:type I restriction enzyme S subunit
MSNGWKRAKLDDHIELLTGFPFKSSEYTDFHGVRLLRGDNIIQNKIRWEDACYWPRNKLTGLSAYELKCGDIVIALDRTWVKAGLKAATITETDLPCLLVQRVARLRANPSMDQAFLAQVIQSHRFEQMAQSSKTETAVPHISPNDIRGLVVEFPPLSEQRKIAGILQTWDDAIETCERLIAAKQVRMTAIRQRLYSATRPGGCPEIAGTWGACTLGDIFSEIEHPNPGLGPHNVITVGKYAIRRQVDHFTRSVASATLENYQLLAPGDFVYDPMSAYYGAIGRYSGALPGIVSPAYTVIRLAEGVDPGFTEGLLKSHYIAFELQSRSSQGNREGKRRTPRSEEFSSIPFTLPPRFEQERISAVLEDVSRDLELTIQSRAALSKQKRGLMQKLLTGEWSVKVDAEAAA